MSILSITFINIIIIAIMGLIIGASGMDISIFTIIIVFFIASSLIQYAYHLYVLLYTKNVKVVDRYLERKKHRPFYGIWYACVKKDFENAERYLEKFGAIVNQTKLSLRAHIQLELNQLREAEETIEKLKYQNNRHFYLASLALSKEDFETFEKHKSQIKHKGLKYSLEAEAAFMREEYDVAEKFGSLAISSSAGLQKWVFMKSLDYQKSNPERKTFF